jgi:hypothetical protein
MTIRVSYLNAHIRQAEELFNLFPPTEGGT